VLDILSSKVDGLEAFDELLIKHRLIEYDIWKTCFMQLKHNEKEGTIPPSSLINMSGETSLLKYFESYCQIKSNVSTYQNLKHSEQFDDFHFVINTNAKMKFNLFLQSEDSDPLSMLS
jgi:hypothetical protein